MESERLEPIAIVGFAGTLPYPGCSTESFWQSICDGESAWGPVPKERFSIDGYYHQNKDRLDTVNSSNGYFLKNDPYKFDAAFFRISPAEAAAMDPHHRCLLECSFKALENAGHGLEDVAASDTSVFVASSSSLEYPMIIGRDPQLHSKYDAVGGRTTIAANRLSHFFDLRGPSMTLDTACSGSLYALHLGCQSIRGKEARMSLIGASNLVLGPEGSHMALSNRGFLLDDGISRCFD